MRYPTRLQPVITVHRDTLLNSQLSPASRLLYVTLLACADGAHINEISALAGITADECADLYLKELRDAGRIETGDHYGQGETITVHEIPIVPSQRSHACVPCTLCGNCSCQRPREICRICDLKREVDQEAAADLARWKRQRAAGATYATGRSGNRLHRWDCPTLNSAEKSMTILKGAEDTVAYGTYHWSPLPLLFTAEELRAKGARTRRCAVCGPDPL